MFVQVEELRIELESRDTSINDMKVMISENEAALTKLRLESKSNSTKLALSEVLPLSACTLYS